MEHRDALFAFAELALALGGFTGIILALGGRADRLERNRIAVALQFLGIFTAATVPLVCIALLEFGFPDDAAWRSGSAIIVASGVAFFVAVTATRRSGPRLPNLYRWSVFGASAAMVAFQLFNGAGLFGAHSYAVLFAGLVYLFFGGAIGFARVLLFEWSDE